MVGCCMTCVGATGLAVPWGAGCSEHATMLRAQTSTVHAVDPIRALISEPWLRGRSAWAGPWVLPEVGVEHPGGCVDREVTFPAVP